MGERLTDEDYRELLRFRDGLRGFLGWSAAQARAQGLTPMQHQLLLAIRGDGEELGPTIRSVADHLLLRHHSAVELVDRAAKAGLVERHGDPGDGRVVRLRLTRAGERKLAALTALHVEELRRLALAVQRVWEGLGVTRSEGSTSTAR